MPSLLAHLQKGLLAEGYAYAEGDPSSWPFTPVLMTASGGEQAVLVVPWLAERAEQLGAFWAHVREGAATDRIGLLAVGQEPSDDAGVQAFLQSAEGAVVYVSAADVSFVRGGGASASPAVLDSRRLGKLLGPLPSKAVKRNPAAELAEAIRARQQTREFFSQARAGQARKPMVTYGLMTISIAVFALMALAGDNGIEPPSRAALLRWGALFGPAVADGEYWRVLTCGFVHIGAIHLAFNMYATLIFGRMLELLQGPWRLGWTFVFAVLTGSAASLAWYSFPLAGGGFTVSAGASGGLFGLMGATGAVLLRYRREFPPSLARGLRQWLTTILLYNALFFFALGSVMDNAAHVGGLVGGFVMSLLLARSPRGRNRPSRAAWAGAAVVTAATLAAIYWAAGRYR